MKKDISAYSHCYTLPVGRRKANMYPKPGYLTRGEDGTYINPVLHAELFRSGCLREQVKISYDGFRASDVLPVCPFSIPKIRL